MKPFCLLTTLLMLSPALLAAQDAAQDPGANPGETAAPKAAPSARLKPQAIGVDGSVWGAVADGDTIYFTISGKDFSMTERLEDGYIAVLKPGEEIPQMLTKAEYLISPRGIFVDGDNLVITDNDHVYKIDKETGKMSAYYSLGSDGPLSGMTGVARMDDRLIATCMDQNRLYFIDEDGATFAQLSPKTPIKSPSGVVWDADKKLLYVCEAAVETDSKGKVTPVGRLLAINPVDGEVTVINPKLKELRGQFVGLALKDGYLYFSDWSNDKKPEAIRKINLEKGDVSNVATSAMEGVGLFTIRGNQLIIPEAKGKKVVIADIPAAKNR